MFALSRPEGKPDIYAEFLRESPWGNWSWLREVPGRREDHLLPHMNRWWLGAKGVEETWLYLSDPAGDRCVLALERSTGVCLVCEEARTQRVCSLFSSLIAFSRDHPEQSGAESRS